MFTHGLIRFLSLEWLVCICCPTLLAVDRLRLQYHSCSPGHRCSHSARRTTRARSMIFLSARHLKPRQEGVEGEVVGRLKTVFGRLFDDDAIQGFILQRLARLVVLKHR